MKENDEMRWIILLLAETGMRLGEVVGLLKKDVILEESIPYIDLCPHPWRSLKTLGSARQIPLIGNLPKLIETMLQYRSDSAYLFPRYNKTDTPILTVHDSFIVPFGEEDRLEKLMKEAFVYVTNKNKTKVKFNKNLTLGQVNQAKHSTGPDRDYYLDSMHAVNENVATEGYRKRLERYTRYHLPD